jgi:bacterioferritin
MEFEVLSAHRAEFPFAIRIGSPTLDRERDKPMAKHTSKGNQDIIKELCVAYGMELETVQNYIANSVHLDGVRSDVIKKALAADVATEVMHAQQLAQRIKTIGGLLPGSLANARNQTYLQPPKDTTDVVFVIKGVIKAEEGAIAQYNKIIRLCDGRDYVTQDMIIGILAGEEDHRREFMGFLKEYAK